MVHVMSLSEVALLAGVERSVVSHWRTRSKAHDPFPDPVRRDGGQELFSCDDIVAWLTRTNLGKNPAFAEHVVAFHITGGRVLTDTRLFHGLTALLCLSARAGHLPDDPEDLLDLAEGRDPDDEFLFSEVEALEDDLLPLARYAALLTRESFDPAAPFDDLMAGRRTPDRPGSRLSTGFSGLALDLALALADDAGFADPVLCLLRPQDITLLATLPDWVDERGAISVALADPGSSLDADARLARRWLAVHDISPLRLSESDGSGLPEQSVVLARLDDDDWLKDLTWLNELTVEVDDSARVVVVGTAAALTGPLRAPGLRGRPPASGAALSEAGKERQQALKSGRTRAILRLPRGQLLDNPAAKSALWCLGPSSDLPSYCADVTGSLEQSASFLVGDVEAAMVGPSARRTRPAPGLFVPQTELVMSDGDLVRPTAGARLASNQGVLRRLDDLVPLVGRPVVAEDELSFEPSPSVGVVQRLTLGEAIGGGHLALLPGARIEPTDLTSRPDVPVVQRPNDLRRTDELAGLSHAVVAQGYGRVSYTLPGDIVFDPRAHPVARVDPVGGVLVAAPARVLRCFVPPVPTEKDLADAKREGRILREQRFVPDLVASEIVEAASKIPEWRAWTITALPAAAIESAQAAAQAVAQRQRQLEESLEQLPELMSTLATALGAGMCTISVTPVERKSA